MSNEYEVQCGVCNETFKMRFSPEERDGCTTDCPHCGTLLICLEGGATAEFHYWLNKQNPSWPADGKNTGVVIFDGDKAGGVYDG